MGQDFKRWMEREFDWDLAPAEFPRLLERLRGTPDRAGRLLAAVPPEAAAVRPDGAWSMLENAGHLGDLEELHHARLEEILQGVATLRPADLTNQRTFAAGHWRRPAAEVVADLRRQREAFLAALSRVSGANLVRSAVHPRLKRPMRVLDLAHFVAEHDDHHLVRAAEIASRLGALSARDLAPGFAEDKECTKRHDVYVLAGAIDIECAGRLTRLDAGHAESLDAPHRARSPEGARLALVDRL